MSFFRRQTADVIRNLEVYSTAELEDIDKNFQFEIPDLARLRTVTEEAVVKMNLYQNGERACGVCEILHEVADISEQELSPQILEVMRKCLAIPEGSNIPPMIIEQYDASGADSSLRGLLLYPPGTQLAT
ncbi:hypothetical protein DVH05_004258 [Phytophthora capsici]|nr:hypothetical protein DVH05_004258 [Phytophthora capsici]